MNIILITGASSGMGREAAKQLDSIYTSGISEIWLVARRTDKLEELSKELTHTTRILPLDLCDEHDLQELELSLSLINPNIKVLVNASGFGILGKFRSGEMKDQTGMVRLNCEALTRVTYLALKYMNKGGRIIQFASAAAFVPQIDFSVYAATKSYVLSFSRSLNEELKKDKISVTAVCPGPVDTEFFKIAEKNNAGFAFKKGFMVKSSDVVFKALLDSYKRKSISVYSFYMQAFRVLCKVIPHSIILKIMNLLNK